MPILPIESVYNENPSDTESIDVESIASMMSASSYTGKVGAAPDMAYFARKECCMRPHKLAGTDQVLFCGAASNCTQHSGPQAGADGWYSVRKGRKFLYALSSTLMTDVEYQVKASQERATQEKAMAALLGSPTFGKKFRSPLDEDVKPIGSFKQETSGATLFPSLPGSAKQKSLPPAALSGLQPGITPLVTKPGAKMPPPALKSVSGVASRQQVEWKQPCEETLGPKRDPRSILEDTVAPPAAVGVQYVDPSLTLALQQMTDTLSRMSGRLTDLEINKKASEPIGSGKAVPPGTTRGSHTYSDPPRSNWSANEAGLGTKAEAPLVTPAPPEDLGWHAVVNALGGRSGVFRTLEEASHLFNGAPEAEYHCFRSFNEAMAWVQDWRAHHSQDLSAINGQSSNADVGNGRTSTRAQFLDSGDPGFLPPLVLSGEDPSTKDEELFEVEISTEAELRTELAPDGITLAAAVDLANSMVDVVALPGTSNRSGESEDTDGAAMELVGSALQELVSSSRGNRTGDRVKEDLQWRRPSRTSLRDAKTQEALRKRLKDLLEVRVRVMKQMTAGTKAILKNQGWLGTRVEAWTHRGFFARIVNDSMEYYLSLHHHLLGLTANGMPWSYVTEEVDHHVDRLTMCRNLQPSRLQALCAIYCYLRKGFKANWQSTSLTARRSQEMYLCMNVGQSQGTASSNPAWCSKCKTSIHPGGAQKCPWKGLTTAKAVKAANDALEQFRGEE